MLRWRSLGELSPFDITWGWEVSGRPMSILALPPQRLRPDSRPEHEDPVSHTATSVGALLQRRRAAGAHHGDKDTGSRSSGTYSLV